MKKVDVVTTENANSAEKLEKELLTLPGVNFSRVKALPGKEEKFDILIGTTKPVDYVKTLLSVKLVTTNCNVVVEKGSTSCCGGSCASQ